MDEIAKLDRLVGKSRVKIMEASTVFPFDFFPDTIRIDENKVDIICRKFFTEKHLASILIKDIKSVKLSTGPIFATLTFDLSGPSRKEDDLFNQPIKYLWKRDAIRIRRIILGLIAAINEEIDLYNIPRKSLIPKIEEIGKSREFVSV